MHQVLPNTGYCFGAPSWGVNGNGLCPDWVFSVTGSDVPGEEAGILYDPKDMVPSDVATMAIGQGL